MTEKGPDGHEQADDGVDTVKDVGHAALGAADVSRHADSAEFGEMDSLDEDPEFMRGTTFLRMNRRL